MMLHEASLLRQEIAIAPHVRVILVDSITQVRAEDAGAIVVAASHGGRSSAEFAMTIPLAAIFFNDAGVGKDNAGIAALQVLQERAVPAATVAHTSARIGDALDMWQHGVLSHVNEEAARRGYERGARLADAVLACAAHPGE